MPVPLIDRAMMFLVGLVFDRKKLRDAEGKLGTERQRTEESLEKNETQVGHRKRKSDENNCLT